MRSDMMLKREMIKITALTPPQLLQKYQNLITKFGECASVKEDFAAWELEFEKAPVCFGGRKLDEQKVLMGKTPVSTDGPKADWSNTMKRNQVHRPVAMKNWLLLYVQRDGQVAEKFANALKGQFNQMGCAYAPPKT